MLKQILLWLAYGWLFGLCAIVVIAFFYMAAMQPGVFVGVGAGLLTIWSVSYITNNDVPRAIYDIRRWLKEKRKK